MSVLLRQPHGFEGLTWIEVGANSPKPSLLELESDASGTVDWSTAPLALAHHAAQADDAIVPVEQAEVFKLPFLPRLVHGREVARRTSSNP